MDGETFMIAFLLQGQHRCVLYSRSYNYTRFVTFRPESGVKSGSQDSQEEGFPFGYGNTMLEVRRQ